MAVTVTVGTLLLDGTMKSHRFRTGIFLTSLAVAAASVWGQEPTIAPAGDLLEGRWPIYEGLVDAGDKGIYFDAKVTPCGNADFREWEQTRRANLGKTASAPCERIPWGLFEYRFDPGGVLTLTRQGKSIVLTARYRKEVASIPNLYVFYDPKDGYAFMLYRPEEDKRASQESLRVFVPFTDILTGSWTILPGRSSTDGRLEVPLSTAAPADALRLHIAVDNSAELRSGSAAARFRLRRTDPTHCVIALERNRSAATGTVILEQAASRLIGPNFLITRWKIGARTMTAVLLAKDSQKPPAVPAVRFEGTEPFKIETLLTALSQPAP